MKDRILRLYDIPCERLSTTGSDERARIEARLREFENNYYKYDGDYKYRESEGVLHLPYTIIPK